MNTSSFLLNAFRELLDEHDVDDVTVQMVLDRSEISRATFYRHFRDKYDLMNAFYRSHITSLLEKVDAGTPWSEVHMQIVCHIYQNKTYYKRAFKTEGPDSFAAFLERFAYDYYASRLAAGKEPNTLSEEDRIAIELVCGGHVTVLRNWVARDFDTPLEIITRVGLEFMPEKLLESL